MSEVLSPSFSSRRTFEPVPFIDLVAQYQTISTEIHDAVTRVFQSQNFVLGDEVAALEQEIADYCDSEYAIGCASGTDALILSLMALDIGPGDEVITTPFSFFATASAICRVGARPVFVDIEPDSFNLDPQAVEAAITPHTKAILPVHLFGQCADMTSLWRLAARHDLLIIEDACQAIGSTYHGRNAGVLGTVGCFSFFPTKNLGGAGDGGMITTDDEELAVRLRRLRVHGDMGGYQHVEVGLNSRLDALQAAVLRVKLRHLDAWSEARRRNADRYLQQFARAGILDDITVPVRQSDRLHVFNQFCVRVSGGRRDAVMKSMRDQGIGCAVYYPVPLHLQRCFAELGYRAGDFPIAETAASDILALPIFPELNIQQQDAVVETLAGAVRQIACRPEIIPSGVADAAPLRRAA